MNSKNREDANERAKRIVDTVIEKYSNVDTEKHEEESNADKEN